MAWPSQLLILAGAGNLAIADGSPRLFVGVSGLAAWLVWLVVTGHERNALSNKPNPGAGSGRPAVYQITVKGKLSADWRAWFDGMTVTQTANGETLITGVVADQAALYGLLRKVRDLGLPLISVTCAQTDQIDEPD